MRNVTINLQLEDGANLHPDVQIGKRVFGNAEITAMAVYDLFAVSEVAERALDEALDAAFGLPPVQDIIEDAQQAIQNIESRR